jgi:hypothetical protein
METKKVELGFVADIDKFFDGWVKKDTHPLRKKGVWADEIYGWVISQHEMVCQGVNRPTEDFAGYHEVFYAGIVDGIELRCVWCSARMGIPSLYIGTKTKKEWIEIRSKLRQAGLIREK